MLRRLGVSIVAILAMLVAMAPSARAELPGSIDVVPADADLYSAMVGAGDLVETIGQSNAWATLMEHPQVKMVQFMLMMQEGNPDSPLAPLFAAKSDPDIQDALQFLGDAFDDEFFMYGDKGAANLLKLYNETNISVNIGTLVLGATGYIDMNDPDDMARMQKVLMLAQISENLHLLQVPNVVLGFKVSDKDLAAEQIGNLEVGLKRAVQDAPIKIKVKRASIEGTEFLTLVIKGESLPWDQIPTDIFEEFEVDEGDLDRVIEHVKKQNLVICLGIKGDYMLLSIGSSTSALRAMGNGPTLATLPEIKKLQAHADENIFTVGYTSKAFNETANDPLGQLAIAADAAKEILDATDIDTDLRDRITADIDETIASVRELVPEPEAMAGISFLTDEGIESYNYNWAVMPTLDGSQPLTILNHIGGDPMLAVASRSKDSEKEYDAIVNIVDMTLGYVEDFAIGQIKPDTEREEAKAAFEKVESLLEKLDKANRELLLPALADGQSALVIDMKLKSKQFIPQMPKSAKALPMIEPAVIIAVSDRAKLEEAANAYWAAASELLEYAQSVEPNADMPSELPKPTKTEEDGITFYTIPALQELIAGVELDSKIAPCLAISDDLAVLAISFEHAKRLITPTECTSGGALADTKANRAMAWVFDWEAMIDGLSKWGRYAVSQQFGGGTQPQMEEMAWMSVQPIIDVLSVAKTVTGDMTVEDGVTVMHSLVKFEDCDPPASAVPAGGL